MMQSTSPLMTSLDAENEILDRLRRLMVPLQVPMPIERIVQECDATIVPIFHMAYLLRVEGGVGRNQGVPGIETKFIVFIDHEVADGPISNYRFVLSEEAAHLFFDAPEISCIRTMEEVFELHQHPDWLTRERNREMIGRILLMPSSLIESEIQNIYSMVVSNEGFISNTYESVANAMARRFSVPHLQMDLRLGECQFDIKARLQKSIGNRSLDFEQLYADDMQVTSPDVLKKVKKRSGPKSPYLPFGEGWEVNR